MFRIKASYADQLELRTTLEKAREFFGELRNFADLMPGIEGIRKEAGGIMRWMVRADVPVIGAVHAAFTVEKTEDSPERLEWSPARSEMKNYLRYAAAFEERGQKVLIRIVQHVELRRKHAMELHRLAILVGPRMEERQPAGPLRSLLVVLTASVAGSHNIEEPIVRRCRRFTADACGICLLASGRRMCGLGTALRAWLAWGSMCQ